VLNSAAAAIIIIIIIIIPWCRAFPEDLDIGWRIILKWILET
jgi:hypothetical protein